MLCTSNNNGNNDGQQQQFLHPSQVPPQLHSHIILVYFQPLARLSFLGLGWHYDRCFTSLMLSDLSLSHCLVLFISPSLNPPCFQISFFFHPLHFIQLEREKKVISFFTFLKKNLDGVALCLLCLLVYALYLTMRTPPLAFCLLFVHGACIYLLLLTFLLLLSLPDYYFPFIP